jgi:hypothetical protein
VTHRPLFALLAALFAIAAFLAGDFFGYTRNTQAASTPPENIILDGGIKIVALQIADMTCLVTTLTPMPTTWEPTPPPKAVDLECF